MTTSEVSGAPARQVPRLRRVLLRLQPRTLSRLLNGSTGLSAKMVRALEEIGRSTAGHWMRMQASYELARVRRDEDDAKRSASESHA